MESVRSHRHVRLVALALLVLVLSPALPAHAATPCFSATGHCIADPFGAFWQSNGGLQVFGYPVATAAPEFNLDLANVYVTQWFERNRLELHAENAPPYKVLLGRLGAERLQQLGRDWKTFPKAAPGSAHYYAVTGHAIPPEFWAYWRGHGFELGDPGTSERESLALFGYPLSEPAVETNAAGDSVLTQWFERARFEYHPTNPQPFRVLLGLLGGEVRAVRSAQVEEFYAARGGSPLEFLLSYYNAINRKEYQRAYDYWSNPGSGDPSQPGDFASFAQGFATTAHVAITAGTPMIEGAAGSVFAQVPVVLMATQTNGQVRTFGGCYVVRRTNPGIDPSPSGGLWRMYRAQIAAAANRSPAELLPGVTCRV